WRGSASPPERGTHIQISCILRCMDSAPMREPTFLVLTALAKAPQHGYAIMRDIAEISAGRVRLKAGTLSAALDRLTAEALIEVDREEVAGGRLRRYYRLTGAGAAR